MRIVNIRDSGLVTLTGGLLHGDNLDGAENVQIPGVTLAHLDADQHGDARNARTRIGRRGRQRALAGGDGRGAAGVRLDPAVGARFSCPAANWLPKHGKFFWRRLIRLLSCVRMVQDSSLRNRPMKITVVSRGPPAAPAAPGRPAHHDGDGRGGTAQLEEALVSAGYRQKVLLDLENTTFIDSSGISWLMICHKHFVQAGGKVVYHSAPPLVQQTLKLLRLNLVLNLADDEDAARAMALEDKK